MNIRVILLLACLPFPAHAPRCTAWPNGQSPGPAKMREVVIVAKPMFREQLYLDIEHGPRPHGGGVRDRRHETWLDFTYRGKTYSELWAWEGWRRDKAPAPVELDEKLIYRFLLRLQEKGRCVVLKIWRGKTLIWSRPEAGAENSLPGGQTAPDGGSEPARIRHVLY